MKDERTEVPSPSIDLAVSANLNQDAGRSSENERRDVSRRGFLGKVLAALAAGAAGFWSWRRPGRVQAATPIICPPQSACVFPTPTPLPDFTVETTNLINNMVANFNAHNAQAVVNIFTSSAISPSALTHMNNAFAAFPNLQMTISSLSVGPLGRSATFNYSITGTHEAAVADSMVVNSGSTRTFAENRVQPELVSVTSASDTGTGTNTYTVFQGRLITHVTGSSNIPSVFAAHGAQIVGVD